MLPTHNGSIRLFRLFEIDVFLHWSWFIVAVWRYQMLAAGGGYSSPVYYAFEVIGLFAIVLMHEFGHSLACRQTGGISNQIVLWPLGGVAYVQPPQRPGAQLWSIAAGPLVNVALVPIIGVTWLKLQHAPIPPDLFRYIGQMFEWNVGLLIFNMLPIYPLDGGQILRSVLWFFMGRGKSLMVAAGIGFAAAGLFVIYALTKDEHSIWDWIIAYFVFSQCMRGWKMARALVQMERTPRREEFECPRCHVSPPTGALWVCQRCGNRFDTFADGGKCQGCGAHYAETQCANCGGWSPVESWRVFGRAVRMKAE